ncbi:MAG: tetratricopeptide repeat protein [Actinomycetota bacterium]|nr:MAG: tetratricopeptide repeat protein [Actinomycetota bacterium]
MRGAVDLGAMAAARQAQEQAAARARTAAADPAAGAGVVLDVTEATFQAEVIDRSFLAPVVIDLWATWCGPCTALSPVLERLAEQYAGGFVLAKVDVDAEPGIAAAFKVQSIPSVFAVLKGQPIPLFQGALPEPQVRAYLDELLRVAEQNGVVASAAAGGTPPAATAEVEPPADPLLEAAFDAVDRGDWDAADAAYAAMLAADPRDKTAQSGRALVGVLRRAEGLDPQQARDAALAAPADLTAQLSAADALLASGSVAEAFDLLVAAVRRSSGEDRDALRARLLELFEVVGSEHPAVAPTRVALANALF